MMTIKNITVLGSGVMGHGIAQVSATAGYNVVLRDIKQEFLDKAMMEQRDEEEEDRTVFSGESQCGGSVTLKTMFSKF